MIFPDCITMIRGAPRIVVGAPRLVSGAPRCSQASHWCSQASHWRSQTCCQCSPVLPGVPKVLSGAPRCSQIYHNHSHGTTVPVISDPSYSEGRQECPRRVWYSAEIDASKFTHHILSDTAGGLQWLKYILLMRCSFWIERDMKMLSPVHLL